MKTCDYCGKDAKLVDGSIIYPHLGHLKQKKFWYCRACDAYVSSKIKNGRLADAHLRRARMHAHQILDAIWKEKILTRSKTYHNLSIILGIKKDKCHIGQFDLETCIRVIAIDYIRLVTL